METWTTKSRTFRTFLLLMELEPEKIRRRLRQARKDTGLTQHQMADLLGVHKRTVENYEHVRVPWDHLTEYARITNRPPEWFLYGDSALPPEGVISALEKAVASLRRDLADLRKRLDALEAKRPPQDTDR